ncbi:MAG: multidrug effflux MFS transporter [Alphaproteobacteria bacterium]|nr:multidrug effflux MFS transporter [Alphaproteobacteria bacterium]
MTALAPFAMNSFIPSIPGIVGYFGTDLATAQLTLTLFLAGLATGQLIYGPLSDRFGRRPPLLFGLVLALAASALCVFAPSAELLNAGRVLQGLGLCAGTVLGRAMVRDSFGRDQSASMLGYVTMAMVVVPAVAPSIGGLLDEWFGWRACFIAMLVFTACVFVWCLRAAHETNRHPVTEISLPGLVQSHRALFRSRAFVGYTSMVTTTSAAFFTFLGGAPYVTITVLELSPLTFALCFTSVAGSYMVGSFLTGRLSVRIGIDRLIWIGLGIGVPSALAMLLAAAVSGPSLIALFLPMAGIALGNGLCQPSGTAAAISTQPRLAGAASGLVGFLQMTAGGIATQIVSRLQDNSLWPVAAMLFGFMSFGLLCHVWTRWRAGPATRP